jgi:hypothetical protein
MKKAIKEINNRINSKEERINEFKGKIFENTKLDKQKRENIK